MCERKYAQIDEEALALTFVIKYFHQYMLCKYMNKHMRKFILRTDHKPFVSIFGKNKGISIMATHRL